MKKYLTIGQFEGGHSLLLDPKAAVRFADELADIGVVNLGIELWYSVEYQGKNLLAEDPYGPDFAEVLQDEYAPQKTAAAAKE